MAAVTPDDVQESPGGSGVAPADDPADPAAVQAMPPEPASPRAVVPARGIGSGQVIGGQRVPVFPLEPRLEITRRRWITDDVIA